MPSALENLCGPSKPVPQLASLLAGELRRHPGCATLKRLLAPGSAP